MLTVLNLLAYLRTHGLDFFAGGPEYFKISPLTWQDNEFIPVLMAKPAE